MRSDDEMDVDERLVEDPAISRHAHSLCRLLLAAHQTSMPLKRDDIYQHLDDLQPRKLPTILAKADILLNSTFGMSIQEFEKNSKGKSQKTGFYTLISTIPAELREACDFHHPQLYTLLTITLSFIYVNQKQILNSVLMKQLAQFGITDDTHEIFDKIDQCFLQWIKQGYFTKGKIVDGDFELFWGPRAEVEFGSQGMDTFILSVFDVEEDVSEKIKVDLKRLSHMSL